MGKGKKHIDKRANYVSQMRKAFCSSKMINKDGNLNHR